MRSSVEDLFERFRGRGDSRALAAVFDRTAPELWRVARHLTQSAHEADDLVQATFVAAIESAPRWRRELPLVPWLLGVLANKLRMTRRREHRRRALERRPVTVARTDPIDDAAHAELRGLLQTCVRELPETYRAVLVLQLEHGLSAAEVANALGRSRATVRSQLHRGLELLRNSLPAGVAPQRGGDGAPDLRTVRGAVLLAVGVPPAKATVPIGVTILMKKLLAVSLALVVGGVFYAWSAAAEPPVPVPTSTPSPLARDTAAVNRGAEPAPERAPAGPVAAAAAPADAIATLSVQVRWSDGGPAPAMWVCLAPADSADWFAQRWLLADRFGVALYRPVTPGAYEVRCRLGGSAAVEVAAGTVNEVELRIPAGIDVRGTVVDPEGRLVPDACIVLGTGSDDALEVARTDGNGAFFLRSVAAGGLVAAFADGFAGSAARPVREFEQGALELRLMGLAGVVTGRVLDADGRPLAGAWVAHGYSHTAMVGGPDAGRAILRTELTDATGSFRLQGVPFAQPWPLHAGAVGHAAWRGEVRVTAGEPEFVEVRLRRAVRLHGTVHDAAGQPQRAHVHVVDANAPGEGIADQRPSWSRAAAFTRADGMFEFANLPAGDLLAAATDHQGGVDSRSFEAGDGDDLTWDPVLASEREIHGRLVDRAGAALAGWRIVAHGDEGVPTPDSATTGDDGAFELRGCAPAVYELFVYAPGDAWHAPILRRPEVRPSPTPVELVVGDGAVPSCRVVGRLAADAAADGLAVVLVGPGGHVAMATDLVAGEPFELGPLPAGTYQLQLQQSRGKGFCAQVVCGLGSCTLAPGQRHDLGDIRMPALGEVEVRLVDAAGDPVARADVVFGLLGAPMGGSAVAIRDGHGLAEFGPGSYLPSYVGDGLCIEHPPFEVTGGRRTIVSLVAAASVHRQVRYDLGAVGWTTRAFATWRKDGRALRWQWFSFWQEKPTVHDEQFTPGVWELELEVGDGSRHRFPFVVTADDTGPILEVVVPK